MPPTSTRARTRHRPSAAVRNLSQLAEACILTAIFVIVAVVVVVHHVISGRLPV